LRILVKSTDNFNVAYKVVIYESKLEKKFSSLKGYFSDDVWVRLLDFLSTTPEQGKKEMQFRKYDLPNGNRILYKVLNTQIVRIVCAGDHNDYEIFLKKYGKKK